MEKEEEEEEEVVVVVVITKVRLSQRINNSNKWQLPLQNQIIWVYVW